MNARYSGFYKMSMLVFWNHYIRPIQRTKMVDADLEFAVKLRDAMTDEDIGYLTGCIDSGLT